MLIEAGYALLAAEKYFKSMPCAQDFYGIMKAIVGSTFRCLERVVAKECKRRIVFINFKLMLKIKMELVHCSDWLDNENKATLFEFVKCVYDLKPSPVTKKQALKLYESIMRRLEFYLHTS